MSPRRDRRDDRGRSPLVAPRFRADSRPPSAPRRRPEPRGSRRGLCLRSPSYGQRGSEGRFRSGSPPGRARRGASPPRRASRPVGRSLDRAFPGSPRRRERGGAPEAEGDWEAEAPRRSAAPRSVEPPSRRRERDGDDGRGDHGPDPALAPRRAASRSQRMAKRRRGFGDGSASVGSESRSHSESSRSQPGGLPMGFMPGVFNPLMMMGAQGMFPSFQGAMKGAMQGAMQGAGMFAPMWGWSGAGMTGGREDFRKGGGKGKRKRSRSRDDDPNKVTEFVTMPRNIMGRVIGKAGSSINKIREESGARIDAEDRTDDQCDFRLQGKPEEVAKAKALIQEVAEKALAERAAGAPGPGGRDDLGEGPCETMEFPITVMGGIIGAKGSKIMDVRSRSGAKVAVDKSDDGKLCIVKMTGTEEEIEKAKALVKEYAEQDPSNPHALANGADSQEAARHETAEFPATVTGRIIGSRGAAIAEVRAQSGARISVEKGIEVCTVHIAGTDEQVQKARSLLTALAEDTGGGGGGARRYPPRDEETIAVPMSSVGRLIGKGGDTVSRLHRESGARIDIDTKTGDPCIVRLTGTRDAISRAKLLISELLARFGSAPVMSGQGGHPGAWGPDMAWGAGPPGCLGFGGWGAPPAGDGTWRPTTPWPQAALPASADNGGAKAAPAASRKADIDLDEL